MDSFIEMILPIKTMPKEFKDGRTVCILRNGTRFYCKWREDKKEWHLGITPIIGATHYSLPALDTETATRISSKPKRKASA